MAQYQLSLYDANLLTNSKTMADYFEESCRANTGLATKDISNWLLGEVSRIMNANNIDISEFRGKVSPEQLCQLLDLMHKGSISVASAKLIFEEMFNTGKQAADIIQQGGLSQIIDTGAIEAEVIAIINSNKPAVADYKVGKTQALKFLVGQVMKTTRGRANPTLVSELMKKKLEEK
jgi:aspartyl-tRNA(Asn)/glutamyl-tRNA(Gln) amidotransferase subunit B